LNNWNTLETPIYELDNTDKTHNLAFHGVWDLPFGKNRPLSISNAVANTIAGDWRFDWILSYVSGYPVGWPNLNNTCGDWGASANNGVQSEDRWLNNDKGQTLPDGTKRPNCYANFPSFFVRTIPDRFPDIREPQKPQLNVALEKTFHISERYKFQFRGEFFNALNHTNLGTPDRFVNTPQFGTITQSTTPGREIQLSARLSF